MAIKESLKHRLATHIDESTGGKPATEQGRTAPAPSAPSKHDGVTQLRAAKKIRVSQLVTDASQPRKDFDPEELDRLAASLKDRGLLQPIRVRWSQEQGVYVIVAGERRYRAALAAGIEELDCIVDDRPLSPDEILEDQLVENAQRQDLRPIEQAHAFQRLMQARGLSVRQLAERLHLSHPTVVRALALLDLPEALQEQVSSGSLAPATAYELSKLDRAEDQIEVAERIAREGLTRDQVAEAVRSQSGKAQGRGPVPATRGRAEFRCDQGRKVVVSGPGADDPAAVIAALKQALKQAQERQRQASPSEAA